jgi:hypothetical protein
LPVWWYIVVEQSERERLAEAFECARTAFCTAPGDSHKPDAAVEAGWKAREAAGYARPASPPPGDVAGLVELLRERDGQEFDGEVHLTSDEARQIASAITALAERATAAEAALAEERARRPLSE